MTFLHYRVVVLHLPLVSLFFGGDNLIITGTIESVQFYGK